MTHNSQVRQRLRRLISCGSIARISLSGLVLSLTGCNIPNLRCPDRTAPIDSTYQGQTSAENSGYLGIQEFFNDPVLVSLITEGLSNNLELKIRNEEVQIASNEILARRGAYLPFLTGGFGGGVNRTSRYTPIGAAEDQLTYPGSGGRNFPSPIPSTALTANLNWQIDIWRELRNARDAAIQRYCEAVEARNYFVTKLVAEIADSYYELSSLDKELVFLQQTIELQKQSLEVAQAQKDAARGTELAVQRFLAEVRKNESQQLIITQQIIEVQNKINFLAGRFPQPVDRQSWDFIQLDSQLLSVGVPAQLLQNRRDIRAAEREVAASGLDVLVAKARFYPRLDLTATIGFEAFNPRYLFDPGAFIAGAAGNLVAPLINKKAIQADYKNANARQLQAIYNYQMTVLNAFTEVVNRISKVENYRQSVEIKLTQVRALEESVSVASNLFQNARAEYMDVLFAQRDLLDARTDLIETKQQQLSAIVNAYQALGGGYLMTNGGIGFADIYGPPIELKPEDVKLPGEEEGKLAPPIPAEPTPATEPAGNPIPDEPTNVTPLLPPSPQAKSSPGSKSPSKVTAEIYTVDRVFKDE
ncbi:TolC family protein [Planctomicrobium sp. SH668]|uniref:TolC family protein n=1 Tax=Planctomicrobium sp. SH668 TaxID=3448126 RepID=UPI003F5B9571